MSLEGLRAWIAEVERKLRARTRVFLALAVIAIGLGGAALYLAIDTRDNAVSESDVQALQEKLETRIDEVAAQTTATAPPVEVEPTPTTPPVEEPNPAPQSGKKGEKAAPKSATGGSPSSAELQELGSKAQGGK